MPSVSERTILLIALLLTATGPAVAAGVVESARVAHDDGHYSLDLHMRIDSPPASVYALVTDYAGLERISPTIIESRLLEGAATGCQRRRLVTETCVWFFCFTATMVEDVAEIDEREIRATIVPDMSDYRSGTSSWQVNPAGAGSRIIFRATLEPDFWIPPVIGTWLLKEKMREEAERTVLNIEALTRPDAP